MSIEALSGKVFVVITGASRGIGRQIAVSFGKILEKGSHVLLLARDLNGLKETAAKLPKTVSVETVSVDLGKAAEDELREIVAKSLKGKEKFDRAVLVHNVGTMGLGKSANEITDADVWRSYLDVNLVLPIVLNGVVMNLLDEYGLPNDKRLLINITSLYGIQPGKGTSCYSTAKAAREMFFRVFAVECPEAIVLSYSPGPVLTDMFNTACEKLSDEETRQKFVEMREKKTALTTEQTVDRLLAVLKDRKYKSGDHVDYYDEL